MRIFVSERFLWPLLWSSALLSLAWSGFWLYVAVNFLMHWWRG